MEAVINAIKDVWQRFRDAADKVLGYCNCSWDCLTKTIIVALTAAKLLIIGVDKGFIKCKRLGNVVEKIKSRKCCGVGKFMTGNVSTVVCVAGVAYILYEKFVNDEDSVEDDDIDEDDIIEVK